MVISLREQFIVKLSSIYSLGFVVVSLVVQVSATAIFNANPEALETVQGYINGLFDSLGVVDETGNISFSGLFANNLRAAMFMVIYGAIPFLFLPVYTIIFNAAIVGVVVALMHSLELPVLAIFMGIIPHGIFEIPAICIAATLGTILCKDIIDIILNKKQRLPFKSLVYEKLKVFALAVVPLLLIAAFVEAYITPTVMMMFV